jgi:hypothetical protein
MLKEMSENLVVTENDIVAASKSYWDFLRRILSEWKVEEAILAARVLKALSQIIIIHKTPKSFSSSTLVFLSVQPT